MTAPAPTAPVLTTEAAAGDPALWRHWQTLRWLDGVAPAPRPVAFVRGDDRDVLVSRGLPGLPGDAPEHRVDVLHTVAELARLLGEVHALDPRGGPRVDAAGRARRAAARLRETGTPPRGDPAYASASASDLADLLERGADRYGRPDRPTLVVGRAGLSNLRLDGGRARGFLDWGAAGLGDPHLDLAVAARSLAAWSPHLVPELVRRYRGPHPELGRLDWYQLLTAVDP